MTDQRRLTQAVVYRRLWPAGLLFGIFNLGINETTRQDIVELGIDNTGDGVEDVAYRWQWVR